MRNFDHAALDRWITGNYGEDQYPDNDEHPDDCTCPECDPDLARDERDC